MNEILFKYDDTDLLRIYFKQKDEFNDKDNKYKVNINEIKNSFEDIKGFRERKIEIIEFAENVKNSNYKNLIKLYYIKDFKEVKLSDDEIDIVCGKDSERGNFVKFLEKVKIFENNKEKESFLEYFSKNFRSLQKTLAGNIESFNLNKELWKSVHIEIKCFYDFVEKFDKSLKDNNNINYIIIDNFLKSNKPDGIRALDYDGYHGRKFIKNVDEEYFNLYQQCSKLFQ